MSTETKKEFSTEEIENIKAQFPSQCFGCDNARKVASDTNQEKGYVGCCAPLRMARRQPQIIGGEVRDEDEDVRYDFISIADEIATGWVDLRSMPFGKSSGIITNVQLITLGVKKCSEYQMISKT